MILNAKPLPPHATTRVSYRELLHGEEGDPEQRIDITRGMKRTNHFDALVQ
ncbi:MAG: hypothetical protein WCA12_02800 [Burkholderiales bacterium]